MEPIDELITGLVLLRPYARRVILDKMEGGPLVLECEPDTPLALRAMLAALDWEEDPRRIGKTNAFLHRRLGSTPPGAPSGTRQRPHLAWGVSRARSRGAAAPAGVPRSKGWGGAALLPWGWLRTAGRGRGGPPAG